MENKIIALLGRGNEGKTTTADYLAREFAIMGHKVTVVSTDNFGSNEGAINLDQVMLGLASIHDAFAPDAGQGYCQIHGGDDLDMVATNLGNQDMIAQRMGKRPQGVLTLGMHLSKLEGIVIIDARAYNQDFWSDSAILAACQVIAVVRPQKDSLDRLEAMGEHVAQADERKWKGVIGTMFGGRSGETVKNMNTLSSRHDFLGWVPLRQGMNKRDITLAYKEIAKKLA
jgi:cellulose biosynthesis protein BcsQ